MLRYLLLAAMLAAPAHAVTITEVGGGPAAGTSVPLDPSDFVGSGPCGFGGSVINDGCSVAIKDSSSPVPSGRFDPLGGSWIDSQDRGHFVWTVEQAIPFLSLTFALTDAFDQFPKPSLGLGPSFFRLSSGDAIWEIASREANATLHWLRVDFDGPTTTAELTFETQTNDGWGVSQPTVAPIPLPATALLLLGGVGLLIGFRRRNRS